MGKGRFKLDVSVENGQTTWVLAGKEGTLTQQRGLGYICWRADMATGGSRYLLAESLDDLVAFWDMAREIFSRDKGANGAPSGLRHDFVTEAACQLDDGGISMWRHNIEYIIDAHGDHWEITPFSGSGSVLPARYNTWQESARWLILQTSRDE